MNEFGQEIGCTVDNFILPPLPNFDSLPGTVVNITPITEADLPFLFKAYSQDIEGRNWTYLPDGPFFSEQDFVNWAQKTCFGQDPKFYTISTALGPVGIACYLRIDPKIGSIEIGYIHFSPQLQRSRAGTEALILMIEWAFESGYRRLEWKCDSLNAPSRSAAQRLGLQYEGLFRQATIYKSRNRDTTWYAATSEDWPRLKSIYNTWRHPSNFTAEGKEVQKLSELSK